MFVAMLDGIRRESVGFLFNITMEARSPAPPVCPGCRTRRKLAGCAAAWRRRAATARSVWRARKELHYAPRVLPPALTYSGPAEDGSAPRCSATAVESTDAGRVPAGSEARAA